MDQNHNKYHQIKAELNQMILVENSLKKKLDHTPSKETKEQIESNLSRFRNNQYISKLDIAQIFLLESKMSLEQVKLQAEKIQELSNSKYFESQYIQFRKNVLESPLILSNQEGNPLFFELIDLLRRRFHNVSMLRLDFLQDYDIFPYEPEAGSQGIDHIIFDYIDNIQITYNPDMPIDLSKISQKIDDYSDQVLSNTNLVDDLITNLISFLSQKEINIVNSIRSKNSASDILNKNFEEATVMTYKDMVNTKNQIKSIFELLSEIQLVIDDSDIDHESNQHQKNQMLYSRIIELTKAQFQTQPTVHIINFKFENQTESFKNSKLKLELLINDSIYLNVWFQLNREQQLEKYQRKLQKDLMQLDTFRFYTSMENLRLTPIFEWESTGCYMTLPLFNSKYIIVRGNMHNMKNFYKIFYIKELKEYNSKNKNQIKLKQDPDTVVQNSSCMNLDSDQIFTTGQDELDCPNTTQIVNLKENSTIQEQRCFNKLFCYRQFTFVEKNYIQIKNQKHNRKIKINCFNEFMEKRFKIEEFEVTQFNPRSNVVMLLSKTTSWILLQDVSSEQLLLRKDLNDLKEKTEYPFQFQFDITLETFNTLGYQIELVQRYVVVRLKENFIVFDFTGTIVFHKSVGKLNVNKLDKVFFTVNDLLMVLAWKNRVHIINMQNLTEVHADIDLEIRGLKLNDKNEIVLKLLDSNIEYIRQYITHLDQKIN